jgi:hypothetical protein
MDTFYIVVKDNGGPGEPVGSRFSTLEDAKIAAEALARSVKVTCYVLKLVAMVELTQLPVKWTE